MKTIDERETQKKPKINDRNKEAGGGGGGGGDTKAIVNGRVLNDFVVSLT